MRHRAFTLIELLVSVSVIALLIAILLPSLKSAREQAKLTACLSNTKNMSLAVLMYAQDNREFFPLSRDHGGFQTGGWINSLEKYAGNKLLYRCPSDKSTNWLNPAHPAEVNIRLNSYATNIYMTPEQPADPFGDDTGPRFGFTRIPTVKFAIETIYLGEYRDTETEPSSDHIHAERWLPDAAGQIHDPREEIAIGRHSKHYENYGYVDGHAESKQFSETFVLDPMTQVVMRDQWDPGFRVKKQRSQTGGNQP